MFERREDFTHAGGVVVRRTPDGEQFLLVRSLKNSAHWVLPKGHLERGETLEACALREVREETGVVGRILRPLGESRYSSADARASIAYFCIECVDELSPLEARERRWCTREEALSRLSFDDARDLVRRAARGAEPEALA